FQPEIKPSRLYDSFKPSPRPQYNNNPSKNRFNDPEFKKEREKATPREGQQLEKKDSIEDLTERMKNMKVAYVKDNYITCFGCGEKGHRKYNCPRNQVNLLGLNDEDSEEEEEDLTYTEEQADRINSLLAELDSINLAVKKEKKRASPYERKRPEKPEKTE